MSINFFHNETLQFLNSLKIINNLKSQDFTWFNSLIVSFLFLGAIIFFYFLFIYFQEQEPVYYACYYNIMEMLCLPC